jgi:hypothetical protein
MQYRLLPRHRDSGRHDLHRGLQGRSTLPAPVEHHGGDAEDRDDQGENDEDFQERETSALTARFSPHPCTSSQETKNRSFHFQLRISCAASLAFGGAQ